MSTTCYIDVSGSDLVGVKFLIPTDITVDEIVEVTTLSDRAREMLSLSLIILNEELYKSNHD